MANDTTPNNQPSAKKVAQAKASAKKATPAKAASDATPKKRGRPPKAAAASATNVKPAAVQDHQVVVPMARNQTPEPVRRRRGLFAWLKRSR